MLSLSGNHLKVFQSMIFSDVVEAIKVSVEESKKLTCCSIYGKNVGQKIYDNFKTAQAEYQSSALKFPLTSLNSKN